jgi:predicted TIM-barrel fold metal-dependent hydrolase
VRALEHALEQGLSGVEISSDAPGREPSDPAYDPLWSRAQEAGAILFVRAARLLDADFHAVRGGNAAALLRLT